MAPALAGYILEKREKLLNLRSYRYDVAGYERGVTYLQNVG